MNKEANSSASSKNELKFLNCDQVNVADHQATGLDIPVVTLSNGLRVANFSSPHSFEFSDGTILPACSSERATLMALHGQEVEMENRQGQVHFVDIVLQWQMSDIVRAELERLSLVRGCYDVLLIPLAVMTALKGSNLSIGRCRCIRKVSRTSNAIHIDRFCI